MNNRQSRCAVVALAALAFCMRKATAQRADLPVYVPTSTVSGVVRVWGSPQMGDLLHEYEKGFLRLQPSVRFEEHLKSTTTAVEGVYTDRADVGLLGREIWLLETQAFESVLGHPPQVIEVATGSFDVPKATFALMVFVPRGNPITALSMEQLARIFGDGPASVRVWGDLGLTGAWAKRPVHLYGFAADNDKSQIFSQLVFKRGQRWAARLKEFSNEGGTDAGEKIVRAVATDQSAIGISNVHYATTNVKALPLSARTGSPAAAPTRETVAAHAYPLTRSVYMVVDRPDAATLEFLRFVLSRQGAEAVSREGNYLPLRRLNADAEDYVR
jgi:phosphate transport system substrate-binding protein